LIQQADQQYPSVSTGCRIRFSIESNALDLGKFQLFDLPTQGFAQLPGAISARAQHCRYGKIYSRSMRFETGLVDAHTHIPDIMNLVTDGAFHPSIKTTRIAEWHDAPEAFFNVGPQVVVTRPQLNP